MKFNFFLTLLAAAFLSLATSPSAQAQKQAPKKTAAKKALVGPAAQALATKPDRTKKPLPGPAPKINLATAEQWTLNNGLRVYFVRDTKLPRVTYDLRLEYDPVLQGAYVGYLSVAGDLMSYGTQTSTKEQLDDEIDFMGANYSVGENGAYTTGLSRYGQRLLEILADVVTKPRMDPQDLELVRKKELSSLAAGNTNPSTISRRVTNRLLYGANHPYGEYVTEESLKKITLDKCKEFFTTYYRPNIASLAIVGNITSEQAHTWTQQYLGAWQKGDVPKTNYQVPPPLAANEIIVVDRPSAVQSVINIAYPVAFNISDSTYIGARVMNDILGGGSSARLFNNLRERHGYTYGAYSSLNASKYIGSFSAGASVRTAVTDSAVAEFLSEMRRIGTEAVADSELTLTKNGISGSFINSLENPQTIAGFALNIARFNLPADFYTNYLKNVAAVSKASILANGARYVKPQGSYVVVVGNGKEIATKLSAFGKVRLLDEYANPVEINPLRPAPAGVTADAVVSKFVDAIGGKAAILKLKDIATTYTGELMGQPFVVDFYRKRPAKSTFVAALGLNEMNRTACNGKASIKKSQQGTTVAAGKELENALVKAAFYPETDLAAAKIGAKLLGLEKVNGQDAYRVEFTYPSGDTWTEHFDATTYLRLRRTETVATPKGPNLTTTEFADYVFASGTLVKVPSVLSMSVGPMSVKLKLTSSKTNTGLADSIFEVK